VGAMELRKLRISLKISQLMVKALGVVFTFRTQVSIL